MTDKVALKDQLFHRGNVARIAAELNAVEANFDAEAFTNRVVERFAELELKQRIDWIAACLADQLLGDFEGAVDVLLRSLPAPCDPTLTDGDYGDFIYAAYSRFVAQHGCTATHVDVSLAALCEITTRFSAEDAIRPFISTFPDQTFAALTEWCQHPHYHVRRLCSEGTRPRLPWSARLATPIPAAIPIIEALHADPTRYVTRSVANHVNDITKDLPDLALDLLERWRDQGRQEPRELDFMIRHATRGLVKQGNDRALALHGVATDAEVTLTGFACDSSVDLGDALAFAFTVTTPHDADLIIDYVIEFPGPTGRIGRKVYKLTRHRAIAHAPATIEHRHLLRAAMTTRKIIPGVHHLEIQINGRTHTTATFAVTAAPPH